MNAPRYSLFAASAPGIEPLLEAELRALGLRTARAEAGGVSFTADLRGIVRAHLGAGLAHSIRLRIARGNIMSFSHLESFAREIDWSLYLRRDEPFDVRAHSRASKLFHTGAIEERVAAAIEMRAGAKFERGAERVLHVRSLKNRMSFALDLSGAPLHQRGYRLETAKAPLREDLARALLILSGWDRESHFVDPMMGAGTLAIEAALLAKGSAPGKNRSFAFTDFPLFHEAASRLEEEREAFASFERELQGPIFGSDRDRGAVEIARRNAERAGLASDELRFSVATLAKAPGLKEPLPPRGLLAVNPPYGKRVGKKSALIPLYQALGERIRTLPPEFKAAMVAADPRLPRLAGSGLEPALLSDHGGVKIRFFFRAQLGDAPESEARDTSEEEPEPAK